MFIYLLVIVGCKITIMYWNFPGLTPAWELLLLDAPDLSHHFDSFLYGRYEKSTLVSACSAGSQSLFRCFLHTQIHITKVKCYHYTC